MGEKKILGYKTRAFFFAFKVVIAPEREEIEPALLVIESDYSRRGTQISFPFLESSQTQLREEPARFPLFPGQ